MKCKIEFSNEADLQDTLARFLEEQGRYVEKEVSNPDGGRIDILTLHSPGYVSDEITLIECKPVLNAHNLRVACEQLLRYSKYHLTAKLVIAGMSPQYAALGKKAHRNAVDRFQDALENRIEIWELDQELEFREWAYLQAHQESWQSRKLDLPPSSIAQMKQALIPRSAEDFEKARESDEWYQKMKVLLQKIQIDEQSI